MERRMELPAVRTGNGDETSLMKAEAIPVMLHATIALPEFSTVPNAYSGVLEPNLMLDCGLAVARSVSSVNQGLTVVHLLNPTTEELYIPCHTKVGQFYAIREEPSDTWQLMDIPAVFVLCTSPVPDDALPAVMLPDDLMPMQISQALDGEVLGSFLQLPIDVLQSPANRMTHQLTLLVLLRVPLLLMDSQF
ncbi:hypothetical protein SKAU_G00215740 [Synaphobranchus kaupii]|uniref:Uncharacterized protein n=1 Tax=Synaphobranchus kaupii TaxID=118154 RepID=A0A9Q1FA17_SYNKA|nr:hypothetical protein SKAU_G00215740 [Synaphobranchus kaupii]